MLKAIDNQEIDLTEYDDALVRQTIECIRVRDSKRIEVIFGGGYTVEETL